MKIFFAWSGAASEQLAEFMREWLPSVIQAVKPFMSTQDIRKGQRWAAEIGTKLADADFAILFLTPTNLNSRWIHYEAGAISGVEGRNVSTLLLDVSPTQIEFPLQQFQHTLLTKRDLLRLVEDINARCKTPLTEARLRKAFERGYPDVEAEMEKLRATLAHEQGGKTAPARSTEGVLTDMLTVQQGMGKELAGIRAEIRTLKASTRTGTYESSRRLRAPLTKAPSGALAARHIGEALCACRLANGWSQSALADKSGVHRRYIAQIESGIQSPSVSVLCRLAQALGVPLTALLGQLERNPASGAARPGTRSGTGVSRGQLN